jgi:hypothetical protein
VRMEAGRIGVGGKEKGPAAARNLISPFPFPLRGKPGREGSPHAAKSAAPPTRGAAAPLWIPRAFQPGWWLTGAGLLMEASILQRGGEFRAGLGQAVGKSDFSRRP